jgi:Ribbon-helix-helix protein, copG family
VPNPSPKSHPAPRGNKYAAKPAEQRKVQISITLTPEAIAKLDELVQQLGTNRSAVIETMIIEK